jgi:hypothetical protein
MSKHPSIYPGIYSDDLVQPLEASTRSFRSFNVRSSSGSVMPEVPRFSIRLFSGCGDTYAQVSDDQVIAAALRILL